MDNSGQVIAQTPNVSPAAGQPLPRYELATPLTTRRFNSGQDGHMVNCFFDTNPSGQKFVMNRSGTVQVYTYGANNNTQGLFWFKGYLFAAVNNSLYNLQALVANNYSTGSGFTAATTATWRPRYYMQAVVFNNQIIVIGGFDGTTTFNDVWASTDGETWKQLCAAAPWGARQGVAACVFNGAIYVSGGLGAGVNYSDVWYSFDGVTWKQASSGAGFAGRAGHRMVAFNGSMFLMGGIGAAGRFNDVWSTTDGTTWVQQVAAATWTARNDFGCAVLNGRIYIFGGDTGANANDCYNTLDGITWTLANAACWATGRSSFAYTVYEGKLWVMGGLQGGGYAATSDIYSSDTNGVNWTLITAAPGFTARGKGVGVVFKAPTAVSQINTPTLWHIGGATGGAAATATVYRGNVNGAANSTWTVPSIGTQVLDSCTANSDEFLVLKDTVGMYLFTGNTLEKVTDANYPQVTVPGVANLDETVYVMDASGLIYGSAIGNPRVWPGWNYIGADYESDPGVALTRHKDYVVAFGTFTTQLFINSGANFGPLLRPVKNANITIGCAFSNSVISINDRLYWIGRGKQLKARRLYRLTGTRAEELPDSVMERLFNDPNVTDITASVWKQDGHQFLTLHLSGVGLAYAFDVDTQLWYRIDWNGLGWPFFKPVTSGTIDYYSRTDLNRIYSPNSSTWLDGGSAMSVDIYTNKIDGGNNRFKFINRMTLIGDRSNATIDVKWSDDDYQTWSAAKTLNLALSRPSIRPHGRFRRRAYWYHYTANAFLRLEAMEFEGQSGPF